MDPLTFDSWLLEQRDEHADDRGTADDGSDSEGRPCRSLLGALSFEQLSAGCAAFEVVVLMERPFRLAPCAVEALQTVPGGATPRRALTWRPCPRATPAGPNARVGRSGAATERAVRQGSQPPGTYISPDTSGFKCSRGLLNAVRLWVRRYCRLGR